MKSLFLGILLNLRGIIFLNELPIKETRIIAVTKEDFSKENPKKTITPKIGKIDTSPRKCKLSDISSSLKEKIKIPEIPKFQNKNPIIAVIDTGIDYGNPELVSRVFLPKELSIKGKLNFGIDVSKNEIDTEPHDFHGHGSHIAGLILAINPNARIIPIKYYNPSASGEDNLKSLIKAIEYSISMNVDIINISGGGPQADLEELKILMSAQKKGILVISALGNERADVDKSPYYPANYNLENILNVMAHDNFFNKAVFSNWGSSAHISTFGSSIKSFSTGNNPCIELSGTSQSTAIVSGFASLLRSKDPNIKFNEIKNIITESTLQINKINLVRPFNYELFISKIK